MALLGHLILISTDFMILFLRLNNPLTRVLPITSRHGTWPLFQF